MALPDPGLNANPVVVTFKKAAGGIAGVQPTASTNTAGNVAKSGVAGTLFAGRPAAATLTYNNAMNFFYVDPTPHTEEAAEFVAVATADPNGFDDIDTFFFNNFSAPAGSPALGLFDLLTVIKHELGHALGWDGDFKKFRARMQGLALPDPPGGIFGGDDLDNLFNSATLGLLTLEGDGKTLSLNESMSNNINELSHLDRTIFANELMNPLLDKGRRRLQSALSIDVLAAAYGYKTNLNPSHVPEPTSLTLLAMGAVSFIGYGWRRKRTLAA